MVDWSKVRVLRPSWQPPNLTPKQRRTLTWLCAIVVALAILTILRRSKRSGEKSWDRTSVFPSFPTPPNKTPPPPIDLTIGDYGDITTVRRDHPLLKQGAPHEISPKSNDMRYTPERVAFEFSEIDRRLQALEEAYGGH